MVLQYIRNLVVNRAARMIVPWICDSASISTGGQLYYSENEVIIGHGEGSTIWMTLKVM